MAKKKFKANIDFPTKTIKKGTVLNLEVDDNGIPYEQFWRRRLKDSRIDNCIEIFLEKRKTEDK